MRAHASKELCAFVHASAPPHYAIADEPTNWLQLRQWYSNAQARDVFPPFPVWDGGSEATIYPDNETNYAFRAWHDKIHCENQYGFNFVDEVRVGLIHMQQARLAGLPQIDLDMLVADTIGQITYYEERGRTFVQNQARFVADVLKLGLRPVIDSGEVY